MKLTKKYLISKIIPRLRKKNKNFLQKLLEDISKKPSDMTNYEKVPAKLIVDGKKYHIMIFRPMEKEVSFMMQ